MIDRADAEALAKAWIDAWNAHDVDAVLANFHPDVVAVSPFAAAIGVEPSGKVRGRDAVRNYYQLGLERSPGLRFVLDAVLVGVDSVTILYHNHTGLQVAETLVLGDGQVVRVMANHGPA